MSEARIFYQEDCNLSLLDGKKIAIIMADNAFKYLSTKVYVEE